MSPRLLALADLRRDDTAFADLLVEIFTLQYTGSIVLHCVNGVPKVAEFPARQVRLSTKPLDKAGLRGDPP